MAKKKRKNSHTKEEQDKNTEKEPDPLGQVSRLWNWKELKLDVNVNGKFLTIQFYMIYYKSYIITQYRLSTGTVEIGTLPPGSQIG